MEIAATYNLTTAVMGIGTYGGQIENEILHRLGQIPALEAGCSTGRAERAQAAAGV